MFWCVGEHTEGVAGEGLHHAGGAARWDVLVASFWWYT